MNKIFKQMISEGLCEVVFPLALAEKVQTRRKFWASSKKRAEEKKYPIKFITIESDKKAKFYGS